jgi:hypothetical protein
MFQAKITTVFRCNSGVLFVSYILEIKRLNQIGAMKVVLLPSLFYEVLIEKTAHQSFSHFFTFSSPLKCRELALTFFLETVLDDDFNPEETHVSVYLRHQNGERVEIITSISMERGEECWQGLERELLLYTRERINAPVVMLDPEQPKHITVLPNGTRGLPMRRSGSVVLALEHNHHLFFRGRKRVVMSA